jgi:shikimate dehydrogenase
MTATSSPRLRAGVMGWPVAHSLSPVLHGHWLKRYGIDGSYEAFPVRPEDLAEAISGLRRDGLRGTNLTVPHKEAAMALVDNVDETAQRIGAVNTLFMTPDGTLNATNTDAYGLIENIRAAAPDALEGRFGGKPVVILGAGGAARAAVVGLADIGVSEIRIVNRTVARAESLAGIVSDQDVVVRALDWEKRDEALAGAGLLVNTTTLGMEGQAPLHINLDSLSEAAVVNDIVYAPLETELLCCRPGAGKSSRRRSGDVAASGPGRFSGMVRCRS